MINNIERAKNIFQVIKQTIEFDFKKWCVSTLGAFITAVPWFITVYLNGYIMKKAISAASEGKGIWAIVLLIISILIFLRIIISVGYGINSWASEKISGKLQMNMVKSYLNKDEKLVSSNVGDVMTRISSDCAVELADFYFQGFGLLVVEPIVTGLAAIITIYRIDWRLAVFSLIMGICSTVVSSLFSKEIQEYTSKSQKENSKVSELVSNMMYGVTTIKLFKLNNKQLDMFKDHCDSVKDFNIKACRRKQFVSACSGIFEMLTTSGCLFLGAIFSKRGELYFPDIMIILQMQVLINTLVSCFGNAWNYFAEVSVYSNRVFEVLGYKMEEQREDKNVIENTNDRFLLECNNISFGYSDDNYVLKNISFNINKGEKVAIVGESGCGKSTLFKILLGLYPQFEGTVKINGMDFTQCSLNSWRKQISVVQQEKELFNKTIAENIALGCDDNRLPSRDEIINAAKLAGAHEFIINLPEGYDTLVGESGNTLSGGQKQQIAIARAFLRNSPLLLLDEFTSALDSESERIVQSSIERLVQNRTVLMITHKLSISKNADVIIVLRDGEIVECGNHDQLMKKHGYYCNMYNIQNIKS